MRLVIMMPVYNDWKSSSMLIERLESALIKYELTANILLLDDGSTETFPSELSFSTKNIENISVLRLRRNLGHQRAIAIGLAYLEDRVEYDTVIIMDADGQDRAEDIPLLLNKLSEYQNKLIVFAERGRRLENFVFQAGYQSYKWLHYLLTGHKVRFGNFSAVPASIVKQLVVAPELWNHYAAAVIVTRLPYTSVLSDRARRLNGHSQMNLQSLTIHGLRALSLFSDTIGLRSLVVLGTTSFIALASIAILLSMKFLFHQNIPIWLLATDMLITLGTIQTSLVLAGITFVLLHSRSTLGMLPMRDYQYFVQDISKLSSFQNQGVYNETAY